jgi:tetratricopeptide (TPR) repeat protein
MPTRFSVTLRRRRNTIENVESGLAVHLAGRVKQVAVRINTSPASHLSIPAQPATSQYQPSQPPPPPPRSARRRHNDINGFPRRFVFGGVGAVGLLIVGIVVAVAVVGDSEAELAYNEGVNLFERGLFLSSIAEFDKAIQLDSDNVGAYVRRGASYNNISEHQSAIANYTSAIEHKPSHVPAYNNRGASYSLLGQYRRSIEDFDKAIEFDPSFAPAYDNRGRSYYKLKQLDRSKVDHVKACSLDSKYC